MLALLGIVSSLVGLIAAISILINERYPERLWTFQSGVIRWHARLLAYLASLVEAYPPFSFDAGPHDPPTASASPGFVPATP